MSGDRNGHTPPLSSPETGEVPSGQRGMTNGNGKVKTENYPLTSNL